MCGNPGLSRTGSFWTSPRTINRWIGPCSGRGPAPPSSTPRNGSDTARLQNIVPAVEPVLVVQVEDGTQTTLTKTDLDKAVGVLEGVYGGFAEGELAHCLQEEEDIKAGGYTVRKIDASKIQGDAAVRVVFFKMALTTGWDCPRAEVMMSFRRGGPHPHRAVGGPDGAQRRWRAASRMTSSWGASPCCCRTMTRRA